MTKIQKQLLMLTRAECKSCGWGEAELETPCDKAKQEQDEPWGTYMGHRLTPERTKEFWGFADAPLTEGTKLYTTPQPRKPLTFEQVEDCFGDGVIAEENGILISAQWLHDFARAIESAHGIKE